MTEEDNATECRFRHYTIVTNDNFHECQCCGQESCPRVVPECAGHCGCEVDEDSEEVIKE